MAKLFPFRPGSTEVSQEPRLVDMEDANADEVFGALSSDTARAILSELYEEPTTASDVAEAVDTSLQNARYHLDKLRDAGLIEEVDTWYSSRGTEMTVYAPTNEPLVVAAGRDESTGVIRDALKRVVGALGVLALASVLVDRLARTGSVPLAGGAGAADAGAAEAAGSPTAQAVAMDTPTATPTSGDMGAMEVATETPTAGPSATPGATGTPTGTPAAEATTAAPEATPTLTPSGTTTPGEAAEIGRRTTAAAMDGGVVETVATIPPGLLFFAGGLTMLVVVAAWRYWSRPPY